MSIWIHRYALTPRRRLSGVAREGAREGALLRVGEGFADLHPWPELGDAPLDEQLSLLVREELTPLTRASLRLAAIDGEARRRGVSLFEGLTIPESHWPGNDPPDGFDTVKIKGLQPVPGNVRMRIDFNASLEPGEYLRVAASLPMERVDFVEDPCPYDPDLWRRLRTEGHLRLALDRFDGEADVLVHKPALQSEWPMFAGEIVVTSYMDHPVGQYGAAYVAATHAVSSRCGLFTHVLYEPEPFIERVRSAGARLLPPGGRGVGFDDLLEELPWKKLT
jgi:O-succinylbenzoate synthase